MRKADNHVRSDHPTHRTQTAAEVLMRLQPDTPELPQPVTCATKLPLFKPK